LGTLPEDSEEEDEGTDEDGEADETESGEEEQDEGDEDEYGDDDDDDEAEDDDELDIEADEDGMGFKIKIPPKDDGGPFSELRQLVDECRKMSAEREDSQFMVPGGPWQF
jgi:hypothetical protein